MTTFPHPAATSERQHQRLTDDGMLETHCVELGADCLVLILCCSAPLPLPVELMPET